MPTLSIEQIARLAINAGWAGEDAAVATAIAMAESSGDTDAVGDSGLTTATWGPSIGLWQIRSLNAQRGTGGQRDEIANRDPATNAKHAYAISNQGSSWGPWSVYTSGRYRSFLPQARLAVGSGGADVPPGKGITGGAAVGGGLDLLDGGTWARLGLFLFGGILLLIALYRMTGVGEAVVKAGKAAVRARTGVEL